MKRWTAIALAAALTLLFSDPVTGASFQSTSLTVVVFADGSALMTQKLVVPSGTSTVVVPLLSPVLSNVVAVDQNGSPLSFKISGSNITVYNLGATEVTLRYDSLNLTGKVGTVWTLAFVAYYNATVVLPAYATLTDVSGTPYAVSVQNQSTILSISPGSWKIQYGVSITCGSTTCASNGSGTGGAFWDDPLLAVAGVSAIVILAVAGLFVYRRRSSGVGIGSGLRPDDIQVLNFIQEKGGKVLEPEIRTRFALPKTSAWRQIKRLERLGYVRVTRVGSQNQIEILRGGSAT